MEYLSHSPEETEHIGEMLGRRLRPGTVAECALVPRLFAWLMPGLT